LGGNFKKDSNALRYKKHWRRKQSSANRSPSVVSLFHGKIQGNSPDFGLEIAKAASAFKENSIAYQENSLVAQTGKFAGDQGT
jgi:hypothetical protein